MAFLDIFRSLGRLLSKAFNIVKASGLTDELIDIALKYVRIAATKVADDSAKREWVVEAIKSRGIPGSIARIAVELAYQLYKREVAPKLGK